MASEALALIGSSAPESELIATHGSAFDALRPRVNLGGVLVDQLDLLGALERVRAFLEDGRPHQIVTINLDFVSVAQRNPQFHQILNRADLAVADGMPLVWLSRLKGMPLTERVAGVDLFAECCLVAAEEDRGVFLLGAAPGVAERAASKLQERYRGLRVVGIYAPPLGPLAQKEDEHIVRLIRDAAPDFLFVALGAPRQEVWISEHRELLDVPIAMGVGCVFDIFAGAVRRAPVWMQRCGLEWAFRLGQEPGRLWRRYLLNDLLTFGQLVLSTHSADPSTSLVVPT